MTHPHPIVYTCCVCGRKFRKPKRPEAYQPYRLIQCGQQTLCACNVHQALDIREVLEKIGKVVS